MAAEEIQVDFIELVSTESLILVIIDDFSNIKHPFTQKGSIRVYFYMMSRSCHDAEREFKTSLE